MSRSQCQQIVPEQELPEGGGEGNGEVPNGHHGHGCDQDPARAQAIRQMAARGLKFKGGAPVEAPYGITAYFTDPDGNHFALLQPRHGSAA